ncbi:MAG: isochorismatase family protein [Dehalococcoidia bacterium]
MKAAVKASGRRKLIMSGLWTGGCPAFTTLDALNDGFEIYAVSDAMGETSADAHERAMQRMIQAGATLLTWGVVLAEIQRDYSRTDTLGDVVEVLGTHLFNQATEPVAV